MSSAYAGSGTSGGGDLCEDSFKSVRDDLKVWIQSGGPAGLKLPQSVSGQNYTSVMLDQISNAKVRCVGQGDEGFPVNMNGTAKVCRFDAAQPGGFFSQATPAEITCDYDKFQAMSASDKYILVHHEYAGLAGIEPPNGDDSDYTISNQISGYLEDQVVTKLVVHPNNSPYDSQSIEGLPAGSVITLNVTGFIPVGATGLTILKTTAPHPFNCYLTFEAASTARTMNDQITLTTTHAPNGEWQRTGGGEDMDSDEETGHYIYDMPGDLLLDGSKTDMKLTCYNNVVDTYSRSELSKIGDLRTFVEQNGGTLSIPSPEPFTPKP